MFVLHFVMKRLCFVSFQSKKHANKVRRYLSIQNETEPSLKKFKSSASDGVSTKGSNQQYIRVIRLYFVWFSIKYTLHKRLQFESVTLFIPQIKSVWTFLDFRMFHHKLNRLFISFLNEDK